MWKQQEKRQTSDITRPIDLSASSSRDTLLSLPPINITACCQNTESAVSNLAGANLRQTRDRRALPYALFALCLLCSAFHHTAIGRANHPTSCGLNPSAQTLSSSIELKSGSSIHTLNRKSNTGPVSRFIHWRNVGLRLCAKHDSQPKQSRMSFQYLHGMTCLNNQCLRQLV